MFNNFWVFHLTSFSFFSEKPPNLLLILSCKCPIASIVKAEKAERKEGRTKAQKTETKGQMVNSTVKGKRKPERPFGKDDFRAPRTEKIRWYQFKYYLATSESLESHFV